MSDKPETVKVRSIDPNGSKTIARLGLTVQPREEVEIPADVAERLLRVRSSWEPVDKGAKAIVAAIEKANQADEKPEEA